MIIRERLLNRGRGGINHEYLGHSFYERGNRQREKIDHEGHEEARKRSHSPEGRKGHRGHREKH